MASDTAFPATFTGAMRASPLYLENGPDGKGVFFAVTTGNDVIALDETHGRDGLDAQHRLVADRQRRRLRQHPPDRHHQHAGHRRRLAHDLRRRRDRHDVDRAPRGARAVGRRRHREARLAGRRLDDRPRAALTFTPPPQNQRSALSLVNGILYVAYGGHPGDCGDYHGWVVGINAAEPDQRGGWATGGQRRGSGPPAASPPTATASSR